MMAVDAKQRFHSSGRAFLIKVRKLLGHGLQAEVRHSKGGPAVMGEVILQGPTYYVCLANSFMNDRGYMRKASPDDRYGCRSQNITILPAWKGSPEAFVEAMTKCGLVPKDE
jgi:hypothetical protein